MDQKKYVDINVFVHWLGNHPQFGQTAYKWIKNIEKSSQGDYITSSLTLYESLVVIAGLTGKNLKDKTFSELVINALTHIKGLTFEQLKSEDFQKALDLMNECKLDYEDSLHLAVAIRAGAQEIISNDKDFEKSSLKRVF